MLLHTWIWGGAGLTEGVRPQGRELAELSQKPCSPVLMAIFHVLEYFFQKALQYNEVPSVLIRSFFTAILVDTPKLCCVISKGGKNDLERNQPGER